MQRAYVKVLLSTAVRRLFSVVLRGARHPEGFSQSSAWFQPTGNVGGLRIPDVLTVHVPRDDGGNLGGFSELRDL